MGPAHRVTPFRPAWWLPGAHLQTIGGRLLRGRLGVPLSRVRIDTPDADFLDVDLAPAPDSAAPVVLVLHGLEGSARSGYMLAAYRYLAEYGLRGVGLNFRSCSGEPNRQPRFYHAGDTGDVAVALDWITARFPGAPVGAVGFSLGGNVLLKYLGEEPARAAERIRAAVAVSVPFDLAAGADQLEGGGLSRVYTAYFMRKLRRKARSRAHALATRCDVTRVANARTLREFDDAATAPLHGFRDSAHYYADSSAHRFLSRIRVPTLVLHATDDPFLPTRAVPHRAVRENPALVDGFTPRGGHVGFVAGAPWTPVFWAEREAARFLARHLSGA